MFKKGIVVVATSSCPPIDLYRDGIKTDGVNSFNHLIGEQLEVVQLSETKNYSIHRENEKKVP
jgi:predicted ATPase